MSGGRDDGEAWAGAGAGAGADEVLIAMRAMVEDAAVAMPQRGRERAA